MPIRMLAKRYGLRCWNVRFALEAQRPTAAETSQMTDPISRELAELVESMITKGLNGRQIWTELMDHHDYLVTYGSIRHYNRYTPPNSVRPREPRLLVRLACGPASTCSVYNSAAPQAFATRCAAVSYGLSCQKCTARCATRR